MSANKRIRLTVEEGQALLLLAVNFGLPEKLGTDHYAAQDRAMAAEEVRKLYREMKSRSPLLQSKQRWHRFGPSDAWIEVKGEGDRIGHKCTDPNQQVEILLDEEVISGMVWCLLLALHPSSPVVANVAVQEDIFWPIAGKLEKSRVIRETIGIGKAKPVRWKSDEDYLKAENQEKEEK